MSQLRKLRRRHARPSHTLLAPLKKRLRAGAFAAASGLSAESITQLWKLRPAQAQALVDVWRDSFRGDVR